MSFGAGGSAVDTGADNNDAVSLREFPAYPYLAFYRLFGLIITAVPGIDCSCFHVVPPKSFWSIVGIKLAAFCDFKKKVPKNLKKEPKCPISAGRCLFDGHNKTGKEGQSKAKGATPEKLLRSGHRITERNPLG